MAALQVTYFSDMLCIWAYVAQARVDQAQHSFADVKLEHRFCSVFGDARTKIETAWRGKGGYEGYNAHVLKVAERFPHVQVNPRIWLDARPASSASPQLFATAVRRWERTTRDLAPGAPTPLFEQVMWQLRLAFFRDGFDIGRWEVQRDLATPLGVDIDAVQQIIRDGTAYAGLAADYQDADKMRVEGSPTFVLNEGRQKFYGNVGFRIIEANIKELLREPSGAEASWC